MLPGVWLRFSVDTLVDACPPSLLSTDGLDLAQDGSVHVAAGFTAVEEHWMAGLARMAELGANLLIEDGFVSGPAAQQRWRDALADLPTGWVGVRCDPAVAGQRCGVSTRTARGTGRPDAKMSRSEDDEKRRRFGEGSSAHRAVQDQANTRRRRRDRAASRQVGH